MSRSYEVRDVGGRFKTVCRVDGFWVTSWLSKKKRTAKQKGLDFVSGKRRSTRHYVTAYGQYLNTINSLKGRPTPTEGEKE